MKSSSNIPQFIWDALAICLALSTLWINVGIPADGPNPQIDRLTSVLLVAMPWSGCLALLLRLSRDSKRTCRIVAIGLVIASARFGMHQIGTYDASSIVEFGWRLDLGQIPFRDFPFTLPPTFAAVVRMCWSVLGRGWGSFVLGSAVSTLALMLCSWRGLTKSGFSSTVNEALMTCGLVIPHLALGHIWHSALTSQIALASATWLVAWRNDKSTESSVVLGSLLGLLVLSKPNVAGPMMIVSTFWIARFWVRRSVAIILTSAGVMCSGILLVSKCSPIEVLRTALQLFSSRSTPAQLFPDGLDGFGKFFFTNTYLILIIGAVVALMRIWVSRRAGVNPDWNSLLLGIGCLISSLAGMSTNWDIKSSDLPLAVVGVLLMNWSSNTSAGKGWVDNIGNLTLSLTLAGLVLINFSIGTSRWRMQLTGPMTQPAESAVMTGRVLDGVHASPLLEAVDQQIGAVVATSHTHNIFLGPRLEIFYSRFNLTSPMHLPLWWHPGTSFTKRDEAGILHAFEDARFSTAIFFKQDFTRFPTELMNVLTNEFTVDDNHSQLTIFRRKSLG